MLTAFGGGRLAVTGELVVLSRVELGPSTGAWWPPCADIRSPSSRGCGLQVVALGYQLFQARSTPPTCAPPSASPARDRAMTTAAPEVADQLPGADKDTRRRSILGTLGLLLYLYVVFGILLPPSSTTATSSRHSAPRPPSGWWWCS